MNKQSGSALFIILIAVALFAALAFTFMQGNRGSTTMMTDEADNAKVTELLGYANDVSSAVKRLKLRGCKETEISFQWPNSTTYENTLTPPDGRCKVFTANGGGITWKTPPVELLDKARAHHTATSYGNYYYSGRVRVMGFGQDCASEACTELVMEVPHLSLTACNAINKKLGIDTNNPSQWATAFPMGATAVNHGYQNQHRFLGVYSFSDSGSTSSYGDDEGFIKGLGAACVNRAGAAVADNPYVFFKVLLSR